MTVGACKGSTSPPAQVTLTYSTYGIAAEIVTLPQSVFAPWIGGSVAVGQTLTVGSPAVWNGSPTPTVSYQWELCSPGCVAISGATGSTFTLTSADVGGTIVLRVTGTNTLGSVSAYSRPAGPVPVPATQPQLPSAAQVNAALSGIAHPSGKQAVTALIKSGSFKADFKTPSGGGLNITWTARVTTGTGKHKKHRTVTIATGSATPGGAGLVHVTIHLTGAGRALLKKHPSGLSVSATAKFRPTGGGSAHVPKKFGL